MKKYSVCFWVCLFVFSTSIQAQVKKFGKIDKSIVTNTVTTTPAEVLFDYGAVKMNKSIDYELVRHTRIKINTEEGLSWSTFEIPFNHAEGESIIEIEGMSYTENERGNVVKNKLTEFDIQEEKVAGNFKRVVVTFPDITEGSVVEIRYKHLIGSPDRIPKWHFAHAIPVHWSEYEAELPIFHEFAIFSKQSEEFFIENSEESYLRQQVDPESAGTYTRTYGSNRFITGEALIRVRSTKLRWVQKDVPVTNTGFDFNSLLVLQYNGVYETGVDAYLEEPSNFGTFNNLRRYNVYTGPPSASRFD